MKTKNALRWLMPNASGSHPKPHTQKAALGARPGHKLNHNKVLRNTIGSALVLAAWDQVAQGQTTNFNYTGDFQYWTVPATGVYRITAFGAQGGSDGLYAYGGFGAKIGSDFSLTSGQVLSVAVGGAGAVSFGNGGGGGGGSFVTLSGNALVIAGGGGGGGFYGGYSPGCGCSHDWGLGLGGLVGGLGGDSYFGGSGGSGGSGGYSGCCGSLGGGGGGGFRGNGGDVFFHGVGLGRGGFGFPAGLAGGRGGGGYSGGGGFGGFGGGGGGGDGGGGGGGYSGGGGGDGLGSGFGGGGGGGGSFNAGLNRIGVKGFQSGNGLVEITVVPKLSITNSAPGFATVSWAPASTNWVLQENVTFGTTNWVNSPSGTNNPVTVPADQPAKFYRLLKE